MIHASPLSHPAPSSMLKMGKFPPRTARWGGLRSWEQHMIPPSSRRRGFTLIEILIVVIILGILAAIVIPQFSSASTDARNSSLASTLQTVKTQIVLYRLAHNDKLPDLTAGWNCLTHKTDINGNIDPANGPTFGPYLQSVPINSLTGTGVPVVIDGTAFVPGADFVYDYAGGSGTGRLWGTTSTANTGALANY